MEIEVQTFDGGRAARVQLRGAIEWEAARPLWERLEALSQSRDVERVVFDFADVDELDSAGIATLSLGLDRLQQIGVETFSEHLSRDHRQALDLMPRHPKSDPEGVRTMGFFEAVGDGGMRLGRSFAQYYDTLTNTVVSALRVLKGHLPPKGSVTREAVKIGVDAFSIIALLSFLLGLILAFQSAHQLKQFGANIYVANLVAISMVREFGPMMTGIILAGRSGSSMAAELSTMTIQEEVDALKTMGIDPNRFLVLPRMTGITIVQPALTLMSMAIGIFGGFLIARFYLDLTPAIYWNKAFAAVDLGDLAHGLGKSVIFSWIIGTIACYSGMNIQGGASAVGRATTHAVVAAIFTIIVADSFFATTATLMG